jgi:hypothetical protein
MPFPLVVPASAGTTRDCTLWDKRAIHSGSALAIAS